MRAMNVRTQHRWTVAFRVLAGTGGAYAVTSLVTVVLSLPLAGLGIDRAEAVTAATLASFAIFAVFAMPSFHARSAALAWSWLIAFAVPAFLLIMLISEPKG